MMQGDADSHRPFSLRRFKVRPLTAWAAVAHALRSAQVALPAFIDEETSRQHKANDVPGDIWALQLRSTWAALRWGRPLERDFGKHAEKPLDSFRPTGINGRDFFPQLVQARVLMRIFHCDHCHQLVFFENVQCLACKHTLAYLPDVAEVAACEKVDDLLWKTLVPEAGGRRYRLCRNYSQENICNWAVPAEDPNPYCVSCRLTRVIPSLNEKAHREAWCALETAKRRLIYSLMALELPLVSKNDDPQNGLAFEFLADPDPSIPNAPKVLTGHNNGVITVNIAEADDAEREKRRVSMHEPYRTLLGHFRHEVGHYYWDRLIRDTKQLERFRELFGDERKNYDGALQAYYQSGPPGDWRERFISAYSRRIRGRIGPRHGCITCT